MQHNLNLYNHLIAVIHETNILCQKSLDITMKLDGDILLSVNTLEWYCDSVQFLHMRDIRERERDNVMLKSVKVCNTVMCDSS